MPGCETVKPEASQSSDSAPCVGCGFCCDGTLFELARAEPHEEQRLKESGLSLRDQNGKRYFEQPCRFSVNGQCTIYDQRFTKCRTFRCKVLRAYQAGKMSRDDALEKVRTAMSLRSAVAAEEPSAVSISARQRLRRQLGGSKERPQLLLKMMALDYYLDLHFRNKNPQVVQPDDAAARE